MTSVLFAGFVGHLLASAGPELFRSWASHSNRGAFLVCGLMCTGVRQRLKDMLQPLVGQLANSPIPGQVALHKELLQGDS